MIGCECKRVVVDSLLQCVVWDWAVCSLAFRERTNPVDYYLLLKTNEIFLIRNRKVLFMLGQCLIVNLRCVMRSLKVTVLVYWPHLITVWEMVFCYFLVIRLLVNVLLIHWNWKKNGISINQKRKIIAFLKAVKSDTQFLGPD
jgi:hypothetical protein